MTNRTRSASAESPQPNAASSSDRSDPRLNLTEEEAAELAERRAATLEWALKIDAETTPEQDAAALAAALADPDAQPLTEEELSRMRPAIEVHPEFVIRHIRSRGRPPTGAAKKLISLRVDTEIVDHFAEGGPGWQTRMVEVLRQHVAGKPPAPKRRGRR